MTTTSNPWWVQRWLTFLATMDIDLQNIRQQGRGLRVKRLDITAGRIRARVQGREKEECVVNITVQPCSDAVWEQVLDRLSQQAAFAAQLLAGQAPQEVERIFGEVGGSLTPTDPEEIFAACSCNEGENCLHQLSVWAAVIEMLRADPWLLFLLRGREREAILTQLRQTRGNPTSINAMQPHAKQNHKPAPLVMRIGALEAEQAEVAGLETQIDNFWGKSKSLRSIHHHVAAPQVELALLRRLGPLGGGGEWQSLHEAMAAIYRTVTDETLALAYQVTPVVEELVSIDEKRKTG